MVELEKWKSRVLLNCCPRFDRWQLAFGKVEYLVRETVKAGQAGCRHAWEAVLFLRYLQQILFGRRAGYHESVTRYFEIDVVVWYILRMLECITSRVLRASDEKRDVL
jgi:hypothetical protein